MVTYSVNSKVITLPKVSKVFFPFCLCHNPHLLATFNWFYMKGWGRSFFVRRLAYRDSTVGFLLLQCFSGVVRHPWDLQVSVAKVSVESSFLFHHSIYL